MSIISPEIDLLKGDFTPIKKLSKEKLRLECEMWRHVWQWVPAAVRYYVAHTGQQMAITRRDYKRYLGILLGTTWELKKIEMGMNDKVFDPITGKYYFEKKIVQQGVGATIDLQWIKERISEAEMEARAEAEVKEDEE